MAKKSFILFLMFILYCLTIYGEPGVIEELDIDLVYPEVFQRVSAWSLQGIIIMQDITTAITR